MNLIVSKRKKSITPSFADYLRLVFISFWRLPLLEQMKLAVPATFLLSVSLFVLVSMTEPPRPLVYKYNPHSGVVLQAETLLSVEVEVPVDSEYLGEEDTAGESCVYVPKGRKSTNTKKKTESPLIAKEPPARWRSANDFIKGHASLAKALQKRYGVPASIILAQALIEGAAGTSKLAVNNNNHFGHKCFAKNCGKGHCTNHTDDTHKDFFRRYSSTEECFEVHARKLSSGRYAHLVNHGNDYKSWAYAQKLINTVRRYALDKYWIIIWGRKTKACPFS